MTSTPPKKSDLGVRTLSAIVMVAVAGTALWLGGWAWTAFVAIVALGVLWEWRALAYAIAKSPAGRLAWIFAGAIYVAIAGWTLAYLRMPYDGIYQVALLLAPIIGVDVGAYFAGRTIGGPKIAPKISPSKTWSGLAGGVLGASLICAVLSWAWPAGLCEAYFDPPLPSAGRFTLDHRCSLAIPTVLSLLISSLFAGALIAVIAQTGDFFESWMKRRAGVKDSSNLIPGHGGLFDRADGLLAVSFVVGLFWLIPGWISG